MLKKIRENIIYISGSIIFALFVIGFFVVKHQIEITHKTETTTFEPHPKADYSEQEGKLDCYSTEIKKRCPEVFDICDKK